MQWKMHQLSISKVCAGRKEGTHEHPSESSNEKHGPFHLRVWIAYNVHLKTQHAPQETLEELFTVFRQKNLDGLTFKKGEMNTAINISIVFLQLF